MLVDENSINYQLRKKSVELWTHCNEYYIAELCVFAGGFCCFLNMRYSEQLLSREDFALGDGAPWCTEGTLTRLLILEFNNCLAPFLNLNTLGRIILFLWEVVLCTGGSLAASQASVHSMPVACPSCENQTVPTPLLENS